MTTTPTVQPTAADSQGAVREAILNLAAGDCPAAFLAQAPGYLASHPEDHPLRWLVGVSLARRGLKTLALETLGALPASMRANPEIADDIAAIKGLPDDSLSIEALHERLRGCAAALRTAGCDLPPTDELVDALNGYVGAARCFRVAGEPALLVVTPGDDDSLDGALARSLGVSDSTALASAYARTQVSANDAFPHPCVLAGVESAPLVVEACRASMREEAGYLPRVHVIEEDIGRAALLLAALGGVLGADGSAEDVPQMAARLVMHVGADALASFERDLRQRLDWALPRAVLATGERDGLHTRVSAVLEGLSGEQTARLEALSAKLQAREDGADVSARAARLAALAGRDVATALVGGAPRAGGVEHTGGPARVLIITTRYTTFLRHSAADLAAALTALGAHAEVFIEPDAGTRVSTLAVAAAVERVDPDLVVTFNYTRQVFGALLPRTLPVVCWVQDAMAHLFNAAAGGAQGPHDVLAGYLFPELFTKFGFDRSRAISLPVPACPRKFAGTLSGGAAERTCELALVSHHSETPEAMHARLSREAAGSPPLARALGMLYPRVRDIATQAHALPPAQRLNKATQDALRSALGAEPPAHVLSMVLHSYSRPLADRFFRHEAVAWAAAVCGRRGWRLNLYGRGWARHPGLSRFAAGEAAHGEGLRDVYAGAGAHLHLSLMSLVHQRVAECGLSGGLVLARWHADSLGGPRASALRALAGTKPDEEDAGRVGFHIDAHPAAARFAALARHVGTTLPGPVLWVGREKFAAITGTPAELAPHDDFDALTGDACRHVFRTRDDLERLTARAIEDPRWREETIEIAMRAAQGGYTYDAAARGVCGTAASVLSRATVTQARAA
jgi:hypothetical protein